MANNGDKILQLSFLWSWFYIYRIHTINIYYIRFCILFTPPPF